MSCLLYVLRHAGWFVLRTTFYLLFTMACLNLAAMALAPALLWLFGNSTTGGL